MKSVRSVRSVLSYLWLILFACLCLCQMASATDLPPAPDGPPAPVAPIPAPVPPGAPADPGAPPAAPDTPPAAADKPKRTRKPRESSTAPAAADDEEEAIEPCTPHEAAEVVRAILTGLQSQEEAGNIHARNAAHYLRRSLEDLALLRCCAEKLKTEKLKSDPTLPPCL